MKISPTKYKTEFCDTIVNIAKEGGHLAAMMVAIDCRSKATFYKWCNKYQEFNDAYEYSKIISQAFYEHLGVLGITGKIKYFNATTYALLMNNKFKEEYVRNPTNSNTEITINTVNLTPEQLDAKISQKIDRLKSLGIEFSNVNNTNT